MTTATTNATLRRLYIDGKWCDADNGRTLGVINPANEEVLAEVAYGGRAETRRALEAAHRAACGPTRPGQRYPNNWVSEVSGSVWEWDDHTSQFYLHSHLKEQPDLNWRNPEVRATMLDVLRFWLDRGVDGFRIDVAHMLMKDPDLRDNPPNPNPEPNPFELQDPEFYSQLHVHDRLHPDLHDVLRSINQVLATYDGEPGRHWRDPGARVGPLGGVLRREAR